MGTWAVGSASYLGTRPSVFYLLRFFKPKVLRLVISCMYLKTRLSDNHLLKFVDLKVLRLSLWLRIDELMYELPVQKRKIFSKNLQDHHQPERAVAGRLPDLLSAFIAALNERACSVRDPRPCSLSLYNTILRFVFLHCFFHMPCQSVTH